MRCVDADQQMEIINLMRALSPYRDANNAKITGTTGQLMLEMAEKKNHLFFSPNKNHEIKEPLFHGEPMALKWHWLKAGNAYPSWQLCWEMDAPQSLAKGRLIYPGPPALYVDVVNGCWGKIDTGSLSSERLGKLWDAPLIPEAMIRHQEATFIDLLGDLPLPPVIDAPHKIAGHNPEAHVHLSAVPLVDRPMRGLVKMTVNYAYSDPADAQAIYRIQSEVVPAQIMINRLATTSAQQSGASRVVLSRDKEAEAIWVDKLQALNLQLGSMGRWVLQERTAQTCWLVWLGDDFKALRDAGFHVQVDEGLTQLLQVADELHIEMQDPVDTSQNQWFDLSLGVDIAGVRHDILPWLPQILALMSDAPLDADGKPELPHTLFVPPFQKQAANASLAEGFVRLNIKPLHPWLSALLDLVGERKRDFEAGGVLKLSRLEALRVGSSIDTSDLGAGVVWDGLGSLKTMFDQLKGQVALPEVPVPLGLQADLRPYQQLGLNWLQFLRAYGLNGVLADDMGLGKTLQTLAHILVEKQSGRMTHPVLVVAPVSLMGNWRREAERFTPQLKVLVFHGLDRHEHGETLAQHDVVLTSYALLHRERTRWLAHPWHMLVLDEAQNIKNANTHAAQTVGELQTNHRLCLSGTPMENHLGELWSLFHFLMPGFLGSQVKFGKLFRTPIEKHGDSVRMAQLRQRVTPFMLRRNKSEVAGELPPKVETISRVKLEGKQADLYETIRLTTEKKVREALATNGLAKSQITILDALLKLRQVCCDPRLVPLAKAKAMKQSAKLAQLMEMIPEMLQEGRKILLFSQFTSMLELIEAELKAREIPWVKLTGQSTKRDALIERFTSGEVPLFLISLKAGGVGLNLPQADTVIHYDPWWNPAVENQATDRAHRIGQSQTVFVYKMVAEGTIEERILALQTRKAALAESMYSGSVGRKQPLFTEGDVMDLLKPLD